MIGWLADLSGFFTGLLQHVLAIGAGGLAVLAWGSRFHPSVRWPLTEVAILVCVAAAIVSAWNASAIRHDQAERVASAERDLERWKETAARQAALRAEYELVASRQSELARARVLDLETMQEIVDDYEDVLAAGGVGACAADDPYRRAMQSIPIHRDPPAGAAGPTGRP